METGRSNSRCRIPQQIWTFWYNRHEPIFSCPLRLEYQCPEHSRTENIKGLVWIPFSWVGNDCRQRGHCEGDACNMTLLERETGSYIPKPNYWSQKHQKNPNIRPIVSCTPSTLQISCPHSRSSTTQPSYLDLPIWQNHYQFLHKHHIL